MTFISAASIDKKNVKFQRVNYGNIVQFKATINGEYPLIYIDKDMHVAVGIKENLYGKKNKTMSYSTDTSTAGINSIPTGSVYGTIDIGYKTFPSCIDSYFNTIKDAFVQYIETYVDTLEKSDICRKYVSEVIDMRSQCNDLFTYQKNFTFNGVSSSYTMTQFTVPKSCRFYLKGAEVSESKLLNYYNKTLSVRVFLQLPSISLTFNNSMPNRYNIKLMVSHMDLATSEAVPSVTKTDDIDFDKAMSKLAITDVPATNKMQRMRQGTAMEVFD